MASDMTEDIIMLIFAALEVPDLVRAGSVCVSWHRAYTSLCNLRRWKQTPCLLYTAKSYGASVASLYNLAEKKPYKLALPDPPIRSRYFIGSAHGWIITADERSELHLVNPVTGDQIALPSVTTINNVTPIYDKNGIVRAYHSWYARGNVLRTPPSFFSLSKLRNHFFQKAFLSSDPSTRSYVVVLIHNPHYQLSFARGGDDCWTGLPPHLNFADCVFKDNIMYALTMFGEIYAFDFKDLVVKKNVVLERVKRYICEIMFLVLAPSGDLLQIWGNHYCIPDVKDVSPPEPKPLEESDHFDESSSDSDDEPCMCYSTHFEVYRVDLTVKKLVEVTSLGECALFLGQNQSVCVRAEEYTQLKANHVYFTDIDEHVVCNKNRTRDIGVLNLGDNGREKIASPQIWSNWPSPVWVAPNPRKINSASMIKC